MSEEHLRINAFIVATQIQIDAFKNLLTDEQKKNYSEKVESEKEAAIERAFLALQITDQEQQHFRSTVDLVLH